MKEFKDKLKQSIEYYNKVQDLKEQLSAAEKNYDDSRM